MVLSYIQTYKKTKDSDQITNEETKDLESLEFKIAEDHNKLGSHCMVFYRLF